MPVDVIALTLFQTLRNRLLSFLDITIDPTATISLTKLGTSVPQPGSPNLATLELITQSLFLLGLAFSSKPAELEHVHATLLKLSAVVKDAVTKER
mgnify:CR=1 FL=1